MKRRPAEPLLRFSPPLASDALHERVVAAAQAALRTSSRPSLTDRIWFSTGWRLAWVASLAILVLTEIAISGVPSRTPNPEHESSAAAAALGLPNDGWVGAYAATFDEVPNRAGEEAL